MPLETENQLPIDVVFFTEAEEFCARLRRHTGRSYRLPSEAEWEYACRAATTTRYHFGDAISQAVANYNDGVTRPLNLTSVGSKQAPNRFGLHDMHGNVEEWCSDWEHLDYLGAPSDGGAWTSNGNSTERIVRGGSAYFSADSARSDSRSAVSLNVSASGYGFRVALDAAGDFYDLRFFREGLVEAAQLSAGSLSAGSIFSIFGSTIGPTAPAELTLDAAGLLRTELAGVQVLCNGRPSALLYVSRNQINAIVPLGISGPAIEVIVKNQGQTSMPVTVPRSEASPALFTINGSGTGQGAILNQDYSINSSASPAPRGSVISLFATGTGPTNPPGKDGEIVKALARSVLPVRVEIAGREASVEYAGSAPELVYGVTQVNVRIPENAPSGQVRVTLFVGNAQPPPSHASRQLTLLSDLNVGAEFLPVRQGDLAIKALDGTDHFLGLVRSEAWSTEGELREGRLGAAGGAQGYVNGYADQWDVGMIHDQVVNLRRVVWQVGNEANAGDFDDAGQRIDRDAGLDGLRRGALGLGFHFRRCGGIRQAGHGVKGSGQGSGQDCGGDDKAEYPTGALCRHHLSRGNQDPGDSRSV